MSRFLHLIFSALLLFFAIFSHASADDTRSSREPPIYNMDDAPIVSPPRFYLGIGFGSSLGFITMDATLRSLVNGELTHISKGYAGFHPTYPLVLGFDFTAAPKHHLLAEFSYMPTFSSSMFNPSSDFGMNAVGFNLHYNYYIRSAFNFGVFVGFGQSQVGINVPTMGTNSTVLAYGPHFATGVSAEYIFADRHGLGFRFTFMTPLAPAIYAGRFIAENNFPVVILFEVDRIRFNPSYFLSLNYRYIFP